MTIICEAVAMYEYEANQEGHISLQVGDTVKVLQQEDSGWWSGIAPNGSVGWFPASFVEQLSLSHLSVQDNNADGNSDSKPNKTAHPDYLQYFTDDGTPYYVNITTNESSWSLPVDVTSPPGSFIQSPFLEPTSPSDEKQAPFLHHISLDKLQKQKRISNASRQTNASSHMSKTVAPSPQKSFKSLTFIDPNPSPRMVDGRYGYADNFVSDNPKNPMQSGFDLLVLKHRNGKEVCKDMAAFMAERTRIEENYAKQLMDLSKSQFGSMEGGTMKTAWNQLKFDMETQAKSRMQFANSLTTKVFQSVMKFKNEQKKTRKDYEATIAAERKLLLERFKKVQRLQALYFSKCQEAEIVDALVSRGQLPNMTRRDFLKVDDNARKERKKASIAAFDYRTAVKDFEEARLTWEENCRNAAQEFEQAELERIDFLKGVLQEYLDAQRQVNDNCKSSGEMCSNSIESVSGVVDVELFVKSKFTGNTKVEPMVFQQYGDYV